MRSLDTLPSSRTFRWIVIVALLGLIVRIAAAGGALWLDEAWSAVMASEVGTPLGVFANINHDNNHHLNSLWLQTVGLGAPPLLARALSILCGSVSILVAGLIGARRGTAAGLITALLFALSPMLVALGSEARGYAPMTLMALIAFWLIDRWLDGDSSAERPVLLATSFYIGVLFQLTMLFVACALIGWPFLVLWRRKGPGPAVRDITRLFALPMIAIVAAIVLVFGPTLIGKTEFVFGAYQPFSYGLFGRGVIGLLGYLTGISGAALWLPAGALLLLILACQLGTSRLAFYWLAIAAFPVAIGLLRVINAGHARYYLLIGLALLLLLGEALAAWIRAGGWRRIAAGGVLAAFAASSASANLDLLQTHRGDPGAAIRALAEREPQGTRVLVDREMGTALIQVAAAEQGYRLDYSTTCLGQPYLFVEWFNDEPRAPAVRLVRCYASYHAIASGISRGPSGQNWTLYERMR